jgi:hypothetical protein
MAVNDNLRFADTEPQVKRAFLRPAKRLLLDARVQLYRWTNRAVRL